MDNDVTSRAESIVRQVVARAAKTIPEAVPLEARLRDLVPDNLDRACLGFEIEKALGLAHFPDRLESRFSAFNEVSPDAQTIQALVGIASLVMLHPAMTPETIRDLLRLSRRGGGIAAYEPNGERKRQKWEPRPPPASARPFQRNRAPS